MWWVTFLWYVKQLPESLKEAINLYSLLSSILQHVPCYQWRAWPSPPATDCSHPRPPWPPPSSRRPTSLRVFTSLDTWLLYLDIINSSAFWCSSIAAGSGCAYSSAGCRAPTAPGAGCGRGPPHSGSPHPPGNASWRPPASTCLGPWQWKRR